jgi:1,4-alpha-glucan branching enzyme
VAEIHTTASLRPTKVELLAGWMGGQRWYAAKGQQPRLRLLATWRLDDPEGEVGVETLVLADEAGPEPVVYQVPLTYRGEPLGSADHALVGTMEHSVLGHRWVYDAPHDPVYAAQLLELVQGRVRAQSSKESGAVEESVRGLPQPSWGPEVRVRTSRVLSGEQSNTSVILDCDLPDGHHASLIVKVFRMLSPGDNPDVVLQGALVDAGSRRVPAVVGSVTGQWPHPGTEGDAPASGHLAFAQEFLPGVEDAWRVALRAAEAGTDFAEPARALGDATAEVHRALADVLGTAPTTEEQAEAIVTEMRARFEAAVAEAPALAGVRGPVDAVLRAAMEASWPPLQRIHGDYHLGQVLLSPGRGWVLLDFEGEPLRPLSERSLPDQWVRDVAGMLRSFDYVGGTLEQVRGRSARDWVTSAQEAFLDGYAARAAEDPRTLGPLLPAFELDKAMYEVVYEARNRPGWLAIPLGAVRRLTAHVRQDAPQDTLQDPTPTQGDPS